MGLILKDMIDTQNTEKSLTVFAEKPVIRRIYLDMDGVLCDFEKKYTEFFGISSKVGENIRKIFTKGGQSLFRMTFSNILTGALELRDC